LGERAGHHASGLAERHGSGRQNARRGFLGILPGSSSNPGGPTFVLAAPYVSNVLPASLVDPVANGLAALYPSPNTPGSLQYVVSIPHTFDSANYGVRLDHRVSNNDSAFFRYTGNGLTTKSGTWNNLIGPGTKQDRRNRAGVQ